MMNTKLGGLALALAIITISQPSLADERFVVPKPKAWQGWKVITNESGGAVTNIERIPADQDPANIKDMVVEQKYVGLRKGVGPELIVALTLRGVAGACEDLRTVGPKVSEEDGHPVAYGQFYCSKQKGKDYGVINMQKAVLGEGTMYVAIREWRIPAFKFKDPNPSIALFELGAVKSEAEGLAWFDEFKRSSEYLAKEVALCTGGETSGACTTK